MLQNNIVAGYERVAYRINGEPCPGNRNDLTKVIVDVFCVSSHVSKCFIGLFIISEMLRLRKKITEQKSSRIFFFPA